MLLGSSRPSRSVAFAHATATANLLLGDATAAVHDLEDVVHLTPTDRLAWDDLGAARYTAAVQDHAPDKLPGALAATEHALNLRPDDELARFNRALILERMGLIRPAIAAWQDVLAGDSDPNWRNEARSHASALAASIPHPLQQELKAALNRAASGDRRSLDQLIRRRTQDVRGTAESIMLAGWADAAAAGDDGTAAHLLANARTVGAALADWNGDRLLLDAVQAIDSSGAGDRRSRLIAGYHLYRDGRLHYRDQLAQSDGELQQAAISFGRAESPMAAVARYYAANVMFDQSHTEDARAMLEHLLGDVDAARHRSLVAGVELELGRYYAFRGIWSAALLHLERASLRFHQLGESTNAAFAEVSIAEVHDRIGQFAEGWRRRVSSLEVLSRFASDDRPVIAVIGGAHAEIMQGDFEAALSLLDLAVQESQRIHNAVTLAETSLRRARVLTALSRQSDASRALAAAREASARITDQPLRARIEADIATVDGESLQHRDPCAAAGVLSAPIQFYEEHDFKMFLPVPYLARARARLACGEAKLALDDLESGLANVERQRVAVAPDVRVTVFDTIPDLIAETVSLLLAQGRVEEAYRVVERARSRTLVEALGVNDRPQSPSIGTAAVVACLPDDAALLEYALLPRGVALFCLTHLGTTAVRIDIDSSRLRELVTAFVSATAERQPLPLVQQQGGRLYDLIIRPAAEAIVPTKRLFIVPDRYLNLLPFPALYDKASRRYLIQQHAVLVAPSGAFLCEQSAKPRITSALILSDPLHGSETARLPAARKEASAVADLYARSVVLVGNDATVDRFRKEAPAAGLIHYAGHAEANDSGGFLPLAHSGGDEGKYDATEISRLPLHRTRLVVLAGCATLIGSARRVEGMPSLSRSFLTAGVPSVIGMLWDIDDAAAGSVLVPFHEAIVHGTAPSDALRDVQRNLAASGDPRLRHPATWAAAELLGGD
jgi:CHAT domain-containing protein